ncbi:MAG TPA: tyrosine-type recombinase/integrase [Pirellulaceae bacterium]|nr:tyrosine-type recombinase/integrase [Pirellulaceae bacterium]
MAYADLVKGLKEIDKERRRPAPPPRDVMPPPPKAQVTVMELCLRYLDFAAKHYRSDDPNRGEYSNVKAVLDKLIAHAGTLPAIEFGPVALKEFRQSLIDKDLSRTYVNQCVSKLKRAFKWAASEELIDVAAWHALTTVGGLEAGRTQARETPKRHGVSWEQVGPVIEAAGPIVKVMIELQWLTGARSGSIVEMKPEQFDRTVDPWIWRPRHKNEFRGQDLLLPIGPRAQELLFELLFRPGGSYVFSPREARRNPRYGEKYSSLTYRQAVERAQERAGVSPGWTPHQLRHARATLVREQFGLEAAQAMLGHASLEATQIYASSRFALAKRIASEIG